MEISTNNLVIILKNAVKDIHYLVEYYNNQLDSVNEHTKKELPKYNYSAILDKFFRSKINAEAKITISESEKRIVDSLIEKYDIIIKDNKKGIIYKYKSGLSEYQKIDPMYARNKREALLNQKNILGDSMLIMMLSSYEYTIANIFKILMHKFPNVYLEEKTLTYSELIKINSDIDEIKKKLVDRVTDEFMRKPLKEWYDHFKIKHGVDVLIECDSFDEFREVYYRRNVIVHNQGKVNENYIKEIKGNHFIGDRLFVDKEYFKNASNIILIMIYQTIWSIKKVFVDSSADLIQYMYEQGYEYMVNQNWKVSTFIFKTIMNNDDIMKYDRMCYRVNYWVSIKNSLGIENIVDEIKDTDFSDLNEIFIIAKNALLDDYTELTKLLEEHINVLIPANYIKEWPLFLQYRETEEYKKFKDNHINDFNEAKFDSDDESAENDTEI